METPATSISTPDSPAQNTESVWIVLPAYNEEAIIVSVIHDIRAAGYHNILVVDDGSKDDTFDAARKTGAVTLHHQLNRGKGAATKTGIEAAKLLGAEVVVTMDGDGQHNPEDIERLIAPIRKKRVDVVLGTRLKDPKGMPWYKIAHNWIGNAVVWYLYGLWVSDSQSGFRAYSLRAAKMIDTKTDRYEYDSEVIREIKKHRLKYCEVPIEVRYTEYSMGKTEKQNFLTGIKTVSRMIFDILK